MMASQAYAARNARQTPPTSKSGGGSPFIVFLLVLGFLGSMVMFGVSALSSETFVPVDQPRSSIPSLGSSEWNLVDPFDSLGGLDHYANLQRAMRDLMVFSAAAGSEWIELDPSSYGLSITPEIRDACNEIESVLTKVPCKIEVRRNTSSDSYLMDVKITSDGHIVSEVQSGYVPIREMLDVLPAGIAPETMVWISSVKVASWATRMHFGSFMWKAIDKIAAVESMKLYGTPAMRLIVDASKMGWCTSFFQKNGITPIPLGPSMWAYYVTP